MFFLTFRFFRLHEPHRKLTDKNKMNNSIHYAPRYSTRAPFYFPLWIGSGKLLWVFHLNFVSSLDKFSSSFLHGCTFLWSDSIHGMFYKKKYFEQFFVIHVLFFINEADDAVKKIFISHFIAEPLYSQSASYICETWYGSWTLIFVTDHIIQLL